MLTARKLADWLETEEKSVGCHHEGEAESIGH
jgi:hypothetical protein